MVADPFIASGRCRGVLRTGLATLLLASLAGWATAETGAPFGARLDEGIRRVEAARQHGAPLGDPDSLFPAREEISLGTGGLGVDHASLREEWRAVPAAGDARGEALSRLHERLQAMRGELAAAQAVADRGAGDLPPRWRERLTEVLVQPEFQKREASPSPLARAAVWLLDKLRALLPQGTTQAVGWLIGWIVHGLAGAALLALAVILVRVTIPLFRRAQPIAQAGGPGAEAARERPEDLLALAETRQRAGDLRGAMQATFRWMLTTLHRAGRLDYDPALTNREHLARLRADGTARSAFADLVGQFELAWYALRPVSPDDYAGFRNRCAALAGSRS